MKKNIFGILFLAIFTISINADYRPGIDYKIVDNPLPVKKDGIVEVTESFWYGCGGCYSFEPAINEWAGKQGADIKFTKMPVPWSEIHRLHAALYYTIDALKVGVELMETQSAGTISSDEITFGAQYTVAPGLVAFAEMTEDDTVLSYFLSL